MKSAVYQDQSGEMIIVIFDDLQVQELDRVDNSIFYECQGEDLNGNKYSATAEFCCGEFEEITEIEKLS